MTKTMHNRWTRCLFITVLLGIFIDKGCSDESNVCGFQLYNTPAKNRDKAKSTCESNNQVLVKISNINKQTQVEDWLRTQPCDSGATPFIGARIDHGIEHCEWDDQQACVFDNWRQGISNFKPRCVGIYLSEEHYGSWTPLDCDTGVPYILCEPEDRPCDVAMSTSSMVMIVTIVVVMVVVVVVILLVMMLVVVKRRHDSKPPWMVTNKPRDNESRDKRESYCVQDIYRIPDDYDVGDYSLSRTSPIHNIAQPTAPCDEYTPPPEYTTTPRHHPTAPGGDDSTISTLSPCDSGTSHAGRDDTALTYAKVTPHLGITMSDNELY